MLNGGKLTRPTTTTMHCPGSGSLFLFHTPQVLRTVFRLKHEYVSFTDWSKKRGFYLEDIDKLPNDKEIIFVHYSDEEVDNKKLEKIKDFIGGESFSLYKLK